MSSSKFRSKKALLAVIVLIAVAGFLVFKPDIKNSTGSSSSTNGQSQGTGGVKPATKDATVETAEFKYTQHVGWAAISAQTLSSTGAASGIGRPTAPIATFSVKVSDVVPKDSNDLKNSTLEGLKKFVNFQLISNVDTKVDGQAGQKFTYTFTDSKGANKTTQQMNVVPYKQKAFFLLFSSTTDDYDKQANEFAKILTSFKFK